MADAIWKTSALEGFNFSRDVLVESVALALGWDSGAQELEDPHDISHLLLWSVFFYTIGLFALNWSVRLALVQPALRWAMTAYHKTCPSQTKIEKMAQSVMEALFYGVSFAVGMAVLSAEPWLYTPRAWFDDDRSFSRRVVAWYYVTYGSRYLQGLVSVIVEHHRKDFAEMVAHHLVTLLLIYLSFHFHEMRIGSAIMVLFDPADVPLHIAKLFKYFDNNTNKVMFLADVSFVVFAIVFFITRVAIYPYMIAESFSSYLFSSPPKREPGMLQLSLLMWITVLWFINLYWAYLIIKLGYGVFVKGAPKEDIRSDDEDDESEEPPIAKAKQKKAQ